jgi:hypothetical protein
MVFSYYYNPNTIFQFSAPIDLGYLEENLKNYLGEYSEGSLNFLNYIILIAISISKYIFMEYDIVGVELNFDDFNSNESDIFNPSNFELINKQDGDPSSSSTNINSNPYSNSTDLNSSPYYSLFNEVQAKQYMNTVRDDWFRRFDPNKTSYETDTVKLGSYMNQSKGWEERLAMRKPDSIYYLRMFYEPLGAKVYVHEGIYKAEWRKEYCLCFDEREFNPVPFELKTPVNTSTQQAYSGTDMLDGIATPFNPNWPPEVKVLYWKAMECNKRAMSERIHSGHYAFYNNDVLMHTNKSKEAMDLCWKYRCSRDFYMEEVFKIVGKN